MTKQWISSNKDSVLIFEDLLYYGELEKMDNGEILDQQEILSKLDSIPLSYLKLIEIDHNKKTSTLMYGKNSDLTVFIQWENPVFIKEFQEFMLKQFPGSWILPQEQKVSSTTKKPMIAMVVIPIVYFIALAIGTDHVYSSSNSRKGGEALIALLQALASMGVFNLTLLFGSLFLIALFALFRARKKSSHITIIQLN
ncbi:hypothetical protein [Fluviicola taffensis]|uniref:hypothetical protein n=1 Tax=Fluviicola taffensis TaxID=191579 RepID=UPI0031380A4F